MNSILSTLFVITLINFNNKHKNKKIVFIITRKYIFFVFEVS